VFIKMKTKSVFLCVVAGFLVLGVNLLSWGAQTRDIDEIRTKPVLDGKDLRIIDDFVTEAVGELVKSTDFTSIAETRKVIAVRKDSDVASSQGQYSGQFLESASRCISEGLRQAAGFTPDERRFKVIVNLLILVNDLEDRRLADIAIGLLGNENAAVRYWAVQCVCSAGMIQKLNPGQPEDAELVARIAGELGKIIETSRPEILSVAADFTGLPRVGQGEDLLVQIARARIKHYADWSVEYELLDGKVLKLLYEKMSSSSSGGSQTGRCFGQLYSYMIQRYIKDLEGDTFLAPDSRQQLASSLVEIERSCVSRFIGVPQITIKRGVEQDDARNLAQEHSRLFGTEQAQGQLSEKLGSDYGPGPDGKKHTRPLSLPEPPENLPADN